MIIRDWCSHSDSCPTIQVFHPVLVLHLAHFFFNPNFEGKTSAIGKCVYVVTNGEFDIILRARGRDTNSPVDGRVAGDSVTWLKLNNIFLQAFTIFWLRQL